MLAQGHLTPIQRPTLAVAVAAAVAAGPLTLEAVHFLIQPVNIQLPTYGQPPMPTSEPPWPPRGLCHVGSLFSRSRILFGGWAMEQPQ